MTENVGHAVVGRVGELLPMLRERAQEAEDARVVSAESIKALEEAGHFRLLQPARFGGYEADPLTFYTAVRLIASACGSTGWVSSVVGLHPWHVGLFPLQAQEEVWGDDPATRISSSYAPTGKAEAVPGGHKLSGRWSFSSGCGHCTWVLLGSFVFSGGKPVDFRTFLLPIRDYRIDDVWDTVGLRGTGSNDIVVDDVLVPGHRSLSFTDMHRCQLPGQEANPAPLYRLPYGSVFSYCITTAIIGMATGAYGAHVEYQRKRVRASYAGAEGRRRPALPGPGGDGGGRDRRRLAGARAQHDRADGVRGGRGEDPAAAPAADPARSGPRDRVVDQRR